MIPLREIENHLERCDEKIWRSELVEAIRERDRIVGMVIDTNVGIISVLCAVYAIYSQFGSF